jgi:hypothetical protein
MVDYKVNVTIHSVKGLSWGESQDEDKGLPNPMVSVCMDLPEGAGEDVTFETKVDDSTKERTSVRFNEIFVFECKLEASGRCVVLVDGAELPVKLKPVNLQTETWAPPVASALRSVDVAAAAPAPPLAAAAVRLPPDVAAGGRVTRAGFSG